jgi:hypothetical protein
MEKIEPDPRRIITNDDSQWVTDNFLSLSSRLTDGGVGDSPFDEKVTGSQPASKLSEGDGQKVERACSNTIRLRD